MRIPVLLGTALLSLPACTTSTAYADPIPPNIAPPTHVTAPAALDARVTRTVLAQNLAILGYQDDLPPGHIGVNPTDLHLSPDGSRLAYLPAPRNPDDLRYVVIDGKSGPALPRIKDCVWSSGSQSFFYVGGAGKTETLYQNNVATPAASAFSGDKIDGVSAVDLAGAPQSSVLYGIQKDGKILIDSNPAPPEMKEVPAATFLSPDAKDMLIEALKDNQLSLWQGGTYLGENARFADQQGPFAPVWSPLGHHVAFAIEVAGHPRLCIDTTPVSELAVRPKLLWNSTGTALLVFGEGLPTVTFDFGADGLPRLAQNTGESALGDAVWSQNGAHFAFFSAQTGKIFVDGQSKTDTNHYTQGEKDVETDPILRVRYNQPSVAVSNEGHFANTSAWKMLMSTDTMVTLHVDGDKTPESFDKIFDIRWSEKLGRPIYLLLQSSLDTPTQAGLAVQLGEHDAVDLSEGPLSNNWRPLFPLTLITPDVARVVFLEGDQIVRYDIQLRKKGIG